jgi:hypothetical protein
VGSGVAQTKAACWDGEFGRPEAANTFGDGELHCYAHSLVDTLDFESLLNLLEHHCVLILNLGRNHEGTFQSGGGIVSRDGHRRRALPRTTPWPFPSDAQQLHHSLRWARVTRNQAPRISHMLVSHAGQQGLRARS